MSMTHLNVPVDESKGVRKGPEKLADARPSQSVRSFCTNGETVGGARTATGATATAGRPRLGIAVVQAVLGSNLRRG